ncbi:hypothetical protein SNEBB_010913 [Seison nebaliae]|nr:hypothetical protein SNEBB_010913 [Seison nebaliae]
MTLDGFVLQITFLIYLNSDASTQSSMILFSMKNLLSFVFLFVTTLHNIRSVTSTKTTRTRTRRYSASCHYGSRVYREMQMFKIRCNECICFRRRVICSNKQCFIGATTNLRKRAVSPALIRTTRGCGTNTCPAQSICQNSYTGSYCYPAAYRNDCQYNGATVANNVMFITGNGCQKCQCSYRKISCAQQPCAQTKSQCFFRGKIMQNQELMPKGDASNLCKCVTGKVLCTRKKTYSLGGKQYCTHRGKVISSLDVIRLNDGCNVCSCFNGERKCTKLKCKYNLCNYEGKVISHGMKVFLPNCMCCICQDGYLACEPDPNCQSKICHYNGTTVSPNATVPKGDDCNECTCTDGQIICTTKVCYCTIGSCDSGKRVMEGQQVMLQNDTRTCKCEQGLITCSCVATSCIHKTKTIADGSIIADGTLLCTCHCGKVTCETMPTPRKLNCEYNGQALAHGQFVPRLNLECNLCTCVDGTVECSNLPCLGCGAMSHKEQKYMDDESCTTCICYNSNLLCTTTGCKGPTETNNCFYNDKTLKHLEFVRNANNGSNTCNCCSCFNGIVKCSEFCCTSELSDCTYGAAVYKHGLNIPTKDCNTCTCDDGKVKCTKLKCTDQCYYENIRYEHEEVMTAADGCNICFCQKGTFLCTNEPCMGGVGLVDKSCHYNGMMYDSGQEFTIKSADGKCTRNCMCRNGEIGCISPQCEGDVSEHNCMINGQMIPHGVVVYEVDGCNKCKCEFGIISCPNLPCPGTYAARVQTNGTATTVAPAVKVVSVTEGKKTRRAGLENNQIL